MSLRYLALIFLVACTPRKRMEVYSPPPTTSAPPPAPTAAPPSVPEPVLGPAFTPNGLIFPPGWQVPPMPSGFALPGMPSGFPPFPPMGAPPSTTAPPPPAQPPPPADTWPATWAQMEDQVLAEVNVRRAAGATCGSKVFGPAGPLAAHQALRGSARGHSKDMGSRGYFDHNTPEGVSPQDRMKAAGWSAGGYTGENIAAGNATAAATVQQWMNSPGHCENIMDPNYQFMGVGYFLAPTAKYKHYWTQNFGGS
ncbi:MAG: CAP domain-containing protein [Polyangiales bacterium]